MWLNMQAIRYIPLNLLHRQLIHGVLHSPLRYLYLTNSKTLTSGAMQPPPPPSQCYSNNPTEPQAARSQAMVNRLGPHCSNAAGSHNENVRSNPNLETSLLLAHVNGHGEPGEETYVIGFAVSSSISLLTIEYDILIC